MEIKNKTDEELVKIIQSGDEGEPMTELLTRYKGLVRSCAAKMYLLGGDRDDLIQEGMIGLFLAAEQYEEEHGASFMTFALLCVNRKIYNAIEKQNGLKHMPLNEYISLSREVYENDGEGTGIRREEQIEDPKDVDPEQLFLGQETVDEINRIIGEDLSGFESDCIRLFIAGFPYTEIAAILSKSPKSVDNALNRAKKKIAWAVTRFMEDP